MTQQRVQIVDPSGGVSFASPEGAARLVDEGWTLVDTTAPPAEPATEEPAGKNAEPLDYKAGVARLKELGYKGKQPKKADLPKLLAEVEAAAAAGSEPAALDEEDLAKISIEQAKELLDARDIAYEDDADLEQLGELLLDWAEEAPKEDLLKAIDDVAALVSEDAS